MLKANKFEKGILTVSRMVERIPSLFYRDLISPKVDRPYSLVYYVI